MCVVYMWYYVLFQYTFTLCNAQISLKHVSVNIFSFFFYDGNIDYTFSFFEIHGTVSV